MGLALGVAGGTCHNTVMDETEHQSLWATEQRRKSILALLDVQPLGARFNPPGAREARPLNPPIELKAKFESGPMSGELNPGEIQSNSSAEARARTSDLAAQRPSKITGDPGLARPQGDMTSDSISADAIGREKSLPPGESVAFQLLIVEAGSWLWLEQIEDNLIRREQLQLVEGMARAITEGAVNLKHHQFDWPLAEHAHLSKDAESARQSVAGQLRRLARERQALGMILMGPTCSEWVNVPPALTQLNIPSTLSMLEKPLLKREAWQVLKAYTPRS